MFLGQLMSLVPPAPAAFLPHKAAQWEILGIDCYFDICIVIVIVALIAVNTVPQQRDIVAQVQLTQN
jgi:hypothetical protein